MFKEIKSSKQGEYLIIDDDFEQIETRVGRSFIYNIIEIYRNRSLNVAANLALVIKYYNIKFNYSFDDLKKYYITDDYLTAEAFSKYEDDVKKYLTLL